MKFEELKQNLQKVIKNGYMLVGGDEYLLSTAYNLIVKYSQIDFPEMNIIKFSEGVIDCSLVVRALETMPILSSKKLVLIDLRMARKSDVKNIKMLNEYMSQPNNMSIALLNVGNNNEDFGVEKNNYEIIDCSKVEQKFVDAKIMSIMKSAGKEISTDAVRLLEEYTICDLSKIIVECNKLIAFVGDRCKVESKDVKEIVNRSVEYQIFELTEALAKKDSVKVYTILDDLRAKKEEFKTLPSLIYSHFRRLFHIALNQKSTNLEISKQLGIKEYAVKMSQGQAKLFSKLSLKKINEMCIALDYDLKMSNISLENAVELIVLTILNM